MEAKTKKPLGRKAYGSIGHLPNSRLGPADHCVNEGMARICTERTRDRHDRVIVQEKLDGSCTAVAMVEGELIALGRAGYPARSSRHEMHHLFADWVAEHESLFREVIYEGERIVGEWLAQAHGTRYQLGTRDPWYAFDIFSLENKRLGYAQFMRRAGSFFQTPALIWADGSLSVEEAMKEHMTCGVPCDEPEGVVYRVERKGEVDFLAKWVRPDKVDGKYLPEVSGQPAVWNWRPE